MVTLSDETFRIERIWDWQAKNPKLTLSWGDCSVCSSQTSPSVADGTAACGYGVELGASSVLLPTYIAEQSAIARVWFRDLQNKGVFVDG
jgi:hypothetical protein